VFLFFRDLDSDYCAIVAVQNKHTDMRSAGLSCGVAPVPMPVVHAPMQAEHGNRRCRWPGGANNPWIPLNLLKSCLVLRTTTLTLAIAPRIRRRRGTIAA
jgi:hypothetical protein